MQEYYVLVPKSLNLEQRLAKFPPDFELSRDYCYYFISDIIKESCNKDAEEYGSFESVINHFIPRCSEINQSIYRNSKQNINYLYRDFGGEGRMLWKRNYKPGGCYAYHLPKYYWGDGELEMYCITDKTFARKIIKINAPQIDNTVRKRFDFTRGYFDVSRFELDAESALNELYMDYLQTGDYNKYLLNAQRVVDFKNGCFNFYNKPETDGRLHTAITSFSKLCRKYLKYDGENLAEVDLSSSIPFFLSYILSIPTISRETKAGILCTQLCSQDILYHYMIVESLVKPSDREIADFRELVLNNELYEYFKDSFMNLPNFESSFEMMFNRQFDGDEDDLRKYTKNKFLAMLFAHPKYYIQEQAVFYNHFPKIYELAKKFKRVKFEGVLPSERHKRLSYLLFQLESYFMVHTIAREINNTFKRKIPFFTLHDCLVVKESDLDQVYELMHEIFIREIGYVPNMTQKIWR